MERKKERTIMSPELHVLRPLGVHPVGQVGDEVVEDHGVHVLTQLKMTYYI